MKKFGLYLQEIKLKNFATFEDQKISFTNKFNSIVGETGSGKSLILDAIQLILGHRADKKLIRHGSEYSTIEATFHCTCNDVKTFFFENDYPFDSDEIIIKRILYKSGKSKSYLNHQSCSLGMLTQFSSQFIDLVGQFENQKLLSESYQLQLLDSFVKIEDSVSHYRDVYSEILEIERRIDELRSNNQQAASRLDYINFQVRELQQLNPTVEDENNLIQLKRKFQDFEIYQKNIEEMNSLFSGSENSKGLFNYLDRIESILESNIATTEQISSFSSAKEILTDLSYSLSLTSSTEYDEEAFEETLETLDLYQKLKRKFNTTTEGLIEIYASFVHEKALLENVSGDLEAQESLLTSLKLKAYSLASDIHEKRLIGAKKLSELLTESIRELMMDGATINIGLSINDYLNKSGVSSINFLAETNKGEGFFKVKDIASGGELSRILLSIRKVLSSNDSISVFLFDEIDSGIGGETALSIGKSLADVANSSQVIAITHLPQIANYSQKLIMVNKSTVNIANTTRTISNVQEIVGLQLKEHVLSMTPLN